MDGIDFLKLEELILLAIAGKAEIYGLEISRDITQATKGKVEINYGSLYPYLNRLENKKYISSRWEEENTRKGARRKYYQVTEEGLQSLNEATFIRQQLRRNFNPDNISSNKPDSNLDEFLQPLQHLKEEVRIQAIQKLGTLSQNYPDHHWRIIQALASFIRINSPINKLIVSTNPDIQEALSVIGKRKVLQDSSQERIDLSFTNLIGVSLKESNLKSVNLKGSNLSSAILKGVNLSGAILEGINLSGARLTSYENHEEYSISLNLSGANLTGANLVETYFEKVNFLCANLSGANLAGADLRGENLSGVNFTEANLAGADLTRANLIRADLTRADLTRANIAEVKNLSDNQLHSAHNWDQAINLFDHFEEVMPDYM